MPRSTMTILALEEGSDRRDRNLRLMIDSAIPVNALPSNPCLSFQAVLTCDDVSFTPRFSEVGPAVII